jgi:hypothetical protein
MSKKIRNSGQKILRLNMSHMTGRSMVARQLYCGSKGGRYRGWRSNV